MFLFVYMCKYPHCFKFTARMRNPLKQIELISRETYIQTLHFSNEIQIFKLQICDVSKKILHLRDKFG